MIDQIDIVVISGNGGDGSISGRREKYVPKGGPDGGRGGDGGSVFIRADRNVNTLSQFRYRSRFEAPSGGNGKPGLKHGANGKDLTVEVPVGTQIYDVTEKQKRGHLVADLSEDGERIILVPGGAGGRGNASFATSINQFPLLAEAGEKGEEKSLRLELKLLADVGLIGSPNAGKSSLLAAVSGASPKIASYPFTTLEPVLGVVEHVGTDFLLVDIPGLIEGAHKGTGLGHDFLRHVERTRALVHVVDASSDGALDDIAQVTHEIGMFNELLLAKPRIVALNKMDVPAARGHADMLEAELTKEDVRIVRISAVARTGLKDLLDLVAEMLDTDGNRDESPITLAQRLAGKRPAVATQRMMKREEGDVPVLRPEPVDRRPSVTVMAGTFVIDAPNAERMAVMVDPDNWSAKQQFYARLRRMGVIQKLEDLGIKTGDTVKLGETEWEWS